MHVFSRSFPGHGDYTMTYAWSVTQTSDVDSNMAAAIPTSPVPDPSSMIVFPAKWEGFSPCLYARYLDST